MKKIKQSAIQLVLAALTSGWASMALASTKLTTCPLITQINKNQMNHWGTKDANFRSYTTSFANELAQFIGAQWQGATVGHVVCIYKTKGNDTFPVVLNFNQLVYEPIGLPTANPTRWHAAHPNHQLYNCPSHHVGDCPFVVRSTPKATNIYQDALNLRKEANPNADNTPNF
jgi:hypothetical protein